MLRIAEITFTNSEGRSITIGSRGKYILTERMTTSGISSTSYTTKAYNQHGRTFLESVYDEQSFTLHFLINNIGLSNFGIQSARREIAEVFLPHLGEGTLSVTLETGDVFLRTVSVDVAPFFPSGFENSNTIWQHVEVELVANNPYWYSSTVIFETFQAVEPQFQFPFTMTGKNDVVKSDYNGKVAGSTVENPNIAFRLGTNETLVVPRVTTMTELDNTNTLTGYPVIESVGGATTLAQTAGLHSTLKRIAQHCFYFDVLQLLERKYGVEVWEGVTSTADKIIKAKEKITNAKATISGYGTSPTGNKANFAIWNKTTSTWVNTVSHTNSVLTDLTIQITNLNDFIDDLGFMYYVHYSNPADTTTNAVIRADYIDMTLNTIFEENINPVIFGNVVPNQYAYNEGQAEAPVTILIFGACVNPTITNVTTGEFIKFKNLTMDADDVLEIDTTFGQKKVLLNGDNVFNKLDFSSTFFNLKTGYNEIDFTDETNLNQATIHFIYNNLFISI